MACLKVAHLGHPVLREHAVPLTDDAIRSDETRRLIDNMIETLHEYEGVGLAGPQVHELKRVVLVEVPPAAGDPVPLIVLLNPEIVEASDEMEEDWEGCLSIPDLRGVVPRAARVRVRGKDGSANEKTISAGGFAARILQHEIDHLDGIVFLDRMTDMKTLTFLPEYGRYWTTDDD